MTTANRQALLDTIAACEGTDGPDGYRALFGYTPHNNRTFDNGYIDHPNIKFAFTQTDGVKNYSTAAGRYQIIHSTWRELKAALDLVDFTPQSQDAAALELIRRTGALADIDVGDLQAAIEKLGGIWASLPSSHYPQPKHTFEFAKTAYIRAGGEII